MDKITNSLWIIFSFVPFFNGFGFIFLSLKNNNPNWLIEGITYELPWFLYLLFAQWFNYSEVLDWGLGYIIWGLYLIGIIRSFWVNSKYLKMLETYDLIE